MPRGERTEHDREASMEMPEQETPQVADVAGGAVDGVMQRFETDNPYLQRLFAHEAFGEVPSGTGQLLRGLETAHPDEFLISAMKVRHGAAQGGVHSHGLDWNAPRSMRSGSITYGAPGASETGSAETRATWFGLCMAGGAA